MNKELIDRAWQALPAEFRKEVREKYRAAKVLSKNTSDIFYYKCELLEHLFGDHNLTSDTEPEEKAPAPEQPVPKFKVGDKVVIRKNAASFHQGYQNGYCWLPERDDYVGKSFTITKILCGGGITLDISEPIYWEPIDLEPYTPTDKAEEKELDLCKLLKVGDEIYSPICGECKLTEFRNYIIIVRANTTPDTYKFFRNGYYHRSGLTTLFPSRALYEQYPLDAAKAWQIWADSQKPKRWTPKVGEKYYYLDRRFIVKHTTRLQSSTIYTFDDTNETTHNCFRTKSDAEYAAQELRKCLERVSEELNHTEK